MADDLHACFLQLFDTCNMPEVLLSFTMREDCEAGHDYEFFVTYCPPTHGRCPYHLMLCAQLLVLLMPASYLSKIWRKHLK